MGLPLKRCDIGKGMYKKNWGVEFVEGTSIVLHPDAFSTLDLPGLLTT